MNKYEKARDYLKVTGEIFKLTMEPEMKLAQAAAIEALGKQIPTVPTFEGDGYSDGELVYDTWICPGCGKSYELEYEEYDYCPKCGQAIDWEVQQDEE